MACNCLSYCCHQIYIQGLFLLLLNYLEMFHSRMISQISVLARYITMQHNICNSNLHFLYPICLWNHPRYLQNFRGHSNYFQLLKSKNITSFFRKSEFFYRAIITLKNNRIVSTLNVFSYVTRP